jgi:hypothetical protein
VPGIADLLIKLRPKVILNKTINCRLTPIRPKKKLLLPQKRGQQQYLVENFNLFCYFFVSRQKSKNALSQES